MQAATFEAYGAPEVLHTAELPKPSLGQRDILVRVHASHVSFADLLVRNFRAIGPQQFHMPLLFWLIGRGTFGLRRPRIRVLGSEFSGVVAAVGKEASRFAPGDAVFGYTGPRMGADAEYLRLSERGCIAHKPASLSHEQASTLPYGAMMALDLLQRLPIRTGTRVLVNGASGGIGALVLQLAKHQYGANVTAVCGPASVPRMRALGADEVIDYTKEDFAQRGKRYDAIIDILGKCSFTRARAALTPDGQLVYVSFKEKQLLQMLVRRLVGGPRVRCIVLSERRENLERARALVEAGVLRAQVDRVYPLTDAAAAHRYAEDGTRAGSVVLSIP
jgi:NADPH:quinone reductase-like Zn-dependent oxidoreductase